MAKEQIPFERFLEDVGPHVPFVMELDAILKEANCVCEIKEAKNGLVVSYVHKPGKRTIANYVFRKKGPLLRVYGDHVSQYMDIFGKWPEEMKKEMASASPCRRMLNPDLCNSRCPMGADYILDGERQQKCRYGAFQFFLGDTANPYMKEMLLRELEARKGA